MAKAAATRIPGVIEQFRLAMNNPAALFAGCLLGGIIPFLTYWVAHRELDLTQGYFQVKTALVAGGLVYSAKTVWQWAVAAFRCPYKASGFVLLIEGTMIASSYAWVAIIALSYLVVINAIATGCTLAGDDRGKGKVKKPVSRSKKASTRRSETSGVRALPKKPKAA